MITRVLILPVIWKHFSRSTGSRLWSISLTALILPVQFLTLSIPKICALEIKIRHKWSSYCCGKFSIQFEPVYQNIGKVEGGMGKMYCVTWSLFWKRVYSWINFWSWLLVFSCGMQISRRQSYFPLLKTLIKCQWLNCSTWIHLICWLDCTTTFHELLVDRVSHCWELRPLIRSCFFFWSTYV